MWLGAHASRRAGFGSRRNDVPFLSQWQDKRLSFKLGQDALARSPRRALSGTPAAILLNFSIHSV